MVTFPPSRQPPPDHLSPSRATPTTSSHQGPTTPTLPPATPIPLHTPCTHSELPQPPPSSSSVRPSFTHPSYIVLVIPPSPILIKVIMAQPVLQSPSPPFFPVQIHINNSSHKGGRHGGDPPTTNSAGRKRSLCQFCQQVCHFFSLWGSSCSSLTATQPSLY